MFYFVYLQYYGSNMRFVQYYSCLNGIRMESFELDTF